MNKKGQGYEEGKMVVYMFFAIFILLIMVLVFAYIINHFKYSTLYTSKDLEENLLMQRFTRSPDCFVYFDYEINRPYPNLLDWEKFTEERLNKCLAHEKISFRLTLENLDNDKEKVIKSANWKNQIKRSLSKDVLIKDDDIWRGNLKIEIQK